MTKNTYVIQKIIDFAAKYGNEITIEKFEKDILELKDAEISCFFARYIEGADIKAHGQIVIESDDVYYNFYFAKYIKGADIKAHQQVLDNQVHESLLYTSELPDAIKAQTLLMHQGVAKQGKKIYLHRPSSSYGPQLNHYVGHIEKRAPGTIKA